jgi:hypothetical protein
MSKRHRRARAEEDRGQAPPGPADTAKDVAAFERSQGRGAEAIERAQSLLAARPELLDVAPGVQDALDAASRLLEQQAAVVRESLSRETNGSAILPDASRGR